MKQGPFSFRKDESAAGILLGQKKNKNLKGDEDSRVKTDSELVQSPRIDTKSLSKSQLLSDEDESNSSDNSSGFNKAQMQLINDMQAQIEALRSQVSLITPMVVKQMQESK